LEERKSTKAGRTRALRDTSQRGYTDPASQSAQKRRRRSRSPRIRRSSKYSFWSSHHRERPSRHRIGKTED
uniref:SRRM2 protein n=1 Tax=Toxocara canis TaxID=6265 RepID=A0A183U2A7_TOXCA